MIDDEVIEIIEKTNLISFINQVLDINIDCHSEMLRYMKMEALWILLNLSYYDSEFIMFLNEPKFVNHLNDILLSDDF